MATATDCSITIERVRELFNYDPDTGVFERAINTRRGIAGTIITHSTLNVDGETHKLTRWIWYHYYGVWPTELIDHINRNQSDNRITNLREATHTQNQQNKVMANPHGFKGVTWRNRKEKPWLSKIRVNGVRVNLGSFATKEEAAKAYAEACLKYHGEFANLGVK